MNTLKKPSFYIFSAVLTSLALLGCKPTNAVEQNGTFTLTPLGTGRAPSSANEIQNAVSRLYAGNEADGAICANAEACRQSSDVVNATDRAIEFQDQVRLKYAQFYSQTQGELPYKSSHWRDNRYEYTDFEFSSAIPSSTPNGKVRGIYIAPIDAQKCGTLLPTLILTNHLYDTLEPQRKLAESLEIIGGRFGIVIVNLPYYGPRAEEGKYFLAPNFEEVRQNYLQGILDFHLVRDWVKTRPRAMPDTFGLVGLSLGSVFSAVWAGLDPVPKMSFGFLAGGGDLASIFMNFIKRDRNEEMAKKYLEAGWTDENVLRRELAAIDPLVWAHRVKGNRIQFINSKEDELMEYTRSISKFHREFAVNNEVEYRWYKGAHSPKANTFRDKLRFARTSFFPLFRFLAADAPPPGPACRRPY